MRNNLLNLFLDKREKSRLSSVKNKGVENRLISGWVFSSFSRKPRTDISLCKWKTYNNLSRGRYRYAEWLQWGEGHFFLCIILVSNEIYFLNHYRQLKYKKITFYIWRRIFFVCNALLFGVPKMDKVQLATSLNHIFIKKFCSMENVIWEIEDQ